MGPKFNEDVYSKIFQSNLLIISYENIGKAKNMVTKKGFSNMKNLQTLTKRLELCGLSISPI